MNEQVSAWLSAIEGLPEAHERLKRVVILCDDALKVIRQQDGENTFFYLDPPYLHETRVSVGAFDCEMSYNQHIELLNVLSGVKGRFLLSGYDSVPYRQAEVDYRWRCVEFEIDCKASSQKQKPKRVGCVWMNF